MDAVETVGKMKCGHAHTTLYTAKASSPIRSDDRYGVRGDLHRSARIWGSTSAATHTFGDTKGVVRHHARVGNRRFDVDALPRIPQDVVQLCLCTIAASSASHTQPPERHSER